MNPIRNSPLSGIIVPVITPVNQQGMVDEPAFRSLLQHLKKGGVHGIFVGGTSGIGPLLSASQWQRMLEIARDEVTDRPLLAGVMETSTTRAIERIRLIEHLGYKYFVLTATYYIPLSQPEAFIQHFGSCRQASDIEMIIYNIPPCTGSSIPISVMEELLKRGWTQVCKDSSNDPQYFSSLCDLAKSTGLQVFQGMRPDFVNLVAQGAVGSVPVPANVCPGPFVEGWNAAASGNLELARSVQPQIDTAWKTLVGAGDFISGSVHALHKLGIGTGEMILPLLQSGQAQKQIIDEWMVSVK